MDAQDQNTPAPGRGMSGAQAAAWIAMLAVGAALVLVMLRPEPAGAPEGEAAPVAVAPEAPADAPAAAADAAASMLDVGMMAPLDYTLPDMDGLNVTLSSFRGKILLINFWATWCGPCKVEIPDLVRLQADYAGDLVVLGVSVDDTPEQMRPYADQYGMNYPVLTANGREDMKDAYGGLWAIPVSVIVDRDGRVHARHVGLGTYEEFEQEIKALL